MRRLQVTLILISSLTVMAGALIAPALPFLTKDFADIPRIDLWAKLVLTFPALFIALFAPVAGLLLDRHGKKRLLLASLIVYGIAGGAGLVINDLTTLLISRAFLGIAVSFLMTGTTALVGDYMEGTARSRFLGTLGAFMAFGGTVFVTISGFLADFGWRYPFAVYLIAFLVFILAWVVLYEPASTSSREEEISGTTNRPFTPLIIIIYLTVLFGMALFYVIPVQSPFLMESLGVSKGIFLSAGLIAGTFFAATASVFHSRLKSWLNYFHVYAVLFAIIGVGFILIWQAESPLAIIAATALAGFGAGFLMPNTSLCLLSQAAPEHRGRVMGGMTSAVFIGQFLSPIIFEPVIQAYGIQLGHAIIGGLALLVGFTFLIAGRPSSQPNLISSP
jgi:MFS family permease